MDFVFQLVLDVRPSARSVAAERLCGESGDPPLPAESNGRLVVATRITANPVGAHRGTLLRGGDAERRAHRLGVSGRQIVVVIVWVTAGLVAPVCSGVWLPLPPYLHRASASHRGNVHVRSRVSLVVVPSGAPVDAVTAGDSASVCGEPVVGASAHPGSDSNPDDDHAQPATIHAGSINRRYDNFIDEQRPRATVRQNLADASSRGLWAQRFWIRFRKHPPATSSGIDLSEYAVTPLVARSIVWWLRKAESRWMSCRFLSREARDLLCGPLFRGDPW